MVLVPTYHKCLIGIVLLLFTCFQVVGQATGDPREDFLYGEYYLQQGLYQKALPFYLASHEENAENANINYRIGFCYSHLLGLKDKALPYLEDAIKEIDLNYVEGYYKRTGAPPEVLLLLGDAYHRDNQLEKASKAYNNYLELVGESDKDALKTVRDRVAGLGISYEYQREGHDYELINLGAEINTRFSDYNPVLNKDQSILVYTQYWESYDRIVFSKLVDGKWSTPVDINEQIGSNGDVYTSSLSKDGKTLLLVRYNNYNSDIYYTNRVDGAWTRMKPLPGKINSRNQESSAGLSSDGEYIYFSSDRSGGEGGFDIYSARWNGKEWSEISNIGKPINSQGNEEAPYLTPDGKILFFSSDGHETIGNMDILFSRLDDSGNWSEPINIGKPVNTTEEDIFFVYFNETGTGYFSRDLKEGFGKNDIYLMLQKEEWNKEEGADSADYQLHSITEGNITATGFITVDKDRSLARVEEQSNAPDNETHEVKSTLERETAIVESENRNIESEHRIIYRSDEKEMDVPVIARKVNSSDVELIHMNESLPEYQQSNENSSHMEKSIVLKNTAYAKDFEQYDSIPTYTIQVIALKKPVDIDFFNLKPLKVSAGDDGLHRYTYGEYRGWSVAISHLDGIKALGFIDAFVRNVISVQNYYNNE